MLHKNVKLKQQEENSLDIWSLHLKREIQEN